MKALYVEAGHNTLKSKVNANLDYRNLRVGLKCHLTFASTFRQQALYTLGLYNQPLLLFVFILFLVLNKWAFSLIRLF